MMKYFVGHYVCVFMTVYELPHQQEQKGKLPRHRALEQKLRGGECYTNQAGKNEDIGQVGRRKSNTSKKPNLRVTGLEWVRE
jgi:hypothetical protein